MKTIAIIDDDVHIGDMLREVLDTGGLCCYPCIFRNRSLICSFTKQA